MRQFVEQTRETKEITRIICNKCGKMIPVVKGVPQQDILSVDKRWGYFSGIEIEEKYVRCMFVRNWRNDAIAVPVADFPDGALQWKQSVN